MFNLAGKKNKFKLNGKMQDKNSVRLDWQAVEGADSYNVFSKNKKLNSEPIKDNFFVAENQKENQIHSYKVVALSNGKKIKQSLKKQIGVAKIKNIDMNSIDTSSLKIPVSPLAVNLEFKGSLFNDASYHYWCTTAIKSDEDGKIHIFASRVPKEICKDFDPGWKRFSEIVHFVSDNPEGPFEEKEIVFSNNNISTDKMWSPHNPKIEKIDGLYCLIFIVQTSTSVVTQRTVLATSKSLYGPWNIEGEDGFILEYDGRIVNPDIIKLDNRYHLYFKSKNKEGKSAFYVAISDELTGPYMVLKNPITNNKRTIEDLDVFEYENKVYLISTDNHGISGYKGAGILWESDDGFYFSKKDAKLGFGKLDDYIEIPKKSKFNFGTIKNKIERPAILFEDDKPTYFYAASGTNIDGEKSCESYVFKIKNSKN